MFTFRHLSFVAVSVAWLATASRCAEVQVGSRVRSLRIGGASVELVTHQAVADDALRWLLCNLHDDEDTSVEAAKKILPEYPVWLLELKHTGEREIVFPIAEAEYRCDPNRIFTPVGVKATLEDLSVWSAESDREVARLGKQLIQFYRLPEMQAIVALHNNTEERYGATSYAKGQEFASDAVAVHMEADSDPDDFFFVTEQRFYDALVKRGYNVVLQNNATVTDDGSLSVYCGQHGIPYVNVEAEHGHLAEQVRMLKSLFEVLKTMNRAQLVDLSQVDATFVIDSPYASSENFAGTRLYPENRLFLEKGAAHRLAAVQQRLAARGLGLKIFDGYRPLSVQKKLWAIMPDPNYVADPAKGSRHNRGCAVDVTLVNTEGNELPMPTKFDEFSEKAHHDYVELPANVLRNRQVLKQTMMEAGFLPLSTEWWHYDATGWEEFPVMDIYPWVGE